MTDPTGNSEFCFQSSLNFLLSNIEGLRETELTVSIGTMQSLLISAYCTHTYIHTYTFIALPEKGFSAAIFKYILKILHELKIEKI